MKENTNKAIAVNSIITYAKIFISGILGLFTTRYALMALGVTDYGLFSVLGSFMSFMVIVKTIMVATCNRFLSVAIGKGDPEEINRVFNVNLSIFLGCALFFLIIAFPVGLWYTNNYINYDGPIENARMVFVFSIVSSLVSTIATPFDGLLMAKERFFLFSLMDVLIHIIRFVVVLLLVYCFTNKLLIYTMLNAMTTMIPLFVYFVYCKKKFPDIVKWKPVRDKKIYKEVFGFSGWVAYGAIATVGRQQGAALIINLFFNTIMNTALGIANTINTYVTMFAHSLTQPMQPQITKSYAAGNHTRTDELLIMSTKFSFMLMLLVGAPFFVGGEWLLHLWLGEVPPFASTFATLLIIDNLVMCFNSGLSPVIFADGRIALYQILINTLRLLSIVAAYIVLKIGMPPTALFYCYIAFSVIVVLATQFCMHKTLKYDMRNVYKESYLPSILTIMLFLPILLLPEIYHPLVNIIMTISYLLLLDYFIVLNKKERGYIVNFINGKIFKRH
jgi:O-antigen/teichoic acid export membrane protein